MYDYVIVGAGRAGIAAVEGIRELDSSGRILVVGAEPHLPYDRPPLTKQLWFGKKAVEEIFLHAAGFFESENIELLSGESVTGVDAGERTILTGSGRKESFGKLLLATGGAARRLPISGGELDGVVYYRTLDDYLDLSRDPAGKSIIVVGGGFIGSEIAAALSMKQARVTMLFPGERLGGRIFPKSLSRTLERQYKERGIGIVAGDEPLLFAVDNGRLVVETKMGERLFADTVVVGAGIEPVTALAEAAGLAVGNGIEIDELLESSVSGIYAAGDNASFPYEALGKRMRVEHWDNALSQGKAAGRNMAGAAEPFTHMPYFYSDLFDFGYEAVGDVRSALTTFADWQEENETGVVYYLENGLVRGVMLCNVWGKLDEARALIQAGRQVGERDLRGAISG